MGVGVIMAKDSGLLGIILFISLHLVLNDHFWVAYSDALQHNVLHFITCVSVCVNQFSSSVCVPAFGHSEAQ